MRDNNEKSDFWRMLDEDIAKHNAMSNDKKSPIQFLADKLTNGKPYTARDLRYYFAEAEAMYKDAIEQAKLDAKEIEIIKQCATQSTSNASAYSDGYSEGYKTALQLVKWKIDNELRTNTQ